MDKERSGMGCELVDRLVNILSVRPNGGGYRFGTKVNKRCGTNVIFLRNENGQVEMWSWLANC